jgi:hypothetical protein
MTDLQRRDFFDLYETSERAALKFLKDNNLIPRQLDSLYNRVKRMNRIYEQEGFETEEAFEEYVELKIDLFSALGIEDPVLSESIEEDTQGELIVESIPPNTNLYDLFTYWYVPLEDIKDSMKEDYAEIAEENEDDWVVATADDIEDFVSAEFHSFEEDEFIYYFKDQLFEGRNYEAYLAFSYGMNYRGSYAYKITQDLKDIIFFDYDASLYFQDTGDNFVKLRMASHDVPMGSDYYILGLSKEEFDLLEDADFDMVQHFIEATIGIE